MSAVGTTYLAACRSLGHRKRKHSAAFVIVEGIMRVRPDFVTLTAQEALGPLL